MAGFTPVQDISKFLESHRNRGQIFRTLQYGSWMLSGLTEARCPAASRKLLTVAERVGQTRVVLRLLDDLPMLASTLQSWRRSGLGENPFVAVTNFLNALAGQLYYPTEHLAWAADNKLIAVDSSPLWTFSVVLWLLSLIGSLIQALAAMLRVNHQLKALRSTESERETISRDNEPSENTSFQLTAPRKKVSFKDQETGARARVCALRRQRFVAILTAIQSLSDMVNAINWLPAGILWSGKLSNLWVGLFGMISSLIGLYKILPRRQAGLLKQS